MITAIFIIVGFIIFLIQILKEEINKKFSSFRDEKGLIEHEVWVAFFCQESIFTSYGKTIGYPY